MIRISLLIGICLSFIFEIAAWAAGYDFVVKTSAQLCGHESPKILGSGVLFQYDSKVYLLTSEHVVFHSLDSKICHGFSSKVFGDQSARLLWADWGSGLALLATNLPAGTGYLNFPADFSDDSETHVRIVGYPFASSTPTIDSGGRVIEENGRRHLFPVLTRTLEISGAHGEFGMSGGAVLSGAPSGSVFRGLLSHQVLELQGGKPTRVKERNGGSGGYNDLIAIPSNEIKLSLRSYFSNPKDYAVSFYRDVNSQLDGVSTVISSGLVFQPLPMNENFLGVDPVGIGGEGTEVRNGVHLDVKLFKSAHSNGYMKTYWPWPERQEWLGQVRSELYLNHSVVLSHLVLQEEDKLHLKVFGAHTPQQYFAYLTNRSVYPAIRKSADGRMIKVGRDLKLYLAEFDEKKMPIQAVPDFRKLNLVAELTSEGLHYVINCKILKYLADVNASNDLWLYLVNQDGKSGVDALSRIKEIAATCR